MRRPLSALLLLAASAGCGGILREDDPATDDLVGELEPPACAEPVAAPSDGHHHPGDDCLACHRQGGDGPPFTIAGTLFEDGGGSAPAAGVTLHFMDAAGADLMVITAANGNFWSLDSIGVPMVAFVARCPDVVPMVTPIGADEVSCNRAGCHTAGFRAHP
jgi:hypothetical protein